MIESLMVAKIHTIFNYGNFIDKFRSVFLEFYIELIQAMFNFFFCDFIILSELIYVLDHELVFAEPKRLFQDE